MQTYSHLLITAVAGAGLAKRGMAVNTKAFLLGAVLPDVALMVLTIGFVGYYRILAPDAYPTGALFGEVYDDFFFHNPVWVISHNFFHAPLILATLMGIGYWAARQGKRWGAGLFWLAAACGLHTVLDIFTHHHDGPLLWFPFDWQTRYAAPISYWDVRYGAGIFAPIEHVLDLVMIVYLVWSWSRRRRTTGPDRQAGHS